MTIFAIPRVRIQSEVYFSVLPSVCPVQSFITSSVPSANTKPHLRFKFPCMFVFILLTPCCNHCRSFWSNPHTCVLSHDVQVSVLHCWFIDLHALLKQVMYACHWFIVFLTLRLHLSRYQNHKVSCGLLFSSYRPCCGSFCCILALQETAQR